MSEYSEDTFCNITQYIIAKHMAHRVIYLFKVIYINKHNSRTLKRLVLKH